MAIKFVLLFCFLKVFLNELIFYEPKEVIDYFNSIIVEDTEAAFIIERLSKTFNDAYAYNELSKNPPNNYKKVDIQKLFKEIKTNNRTQYNFYQDIKKVLGQLEDLHINFDLSSYIPLYNALYINQPLRLYIKIYNNKPRFFGYSYHIDEAKSHFKNNVEVFKIINNNLNTPIYSINVKDPFDYITDFGKDYLSLKSPYATFVNNFNKFNSNFSFYSLPLSIEDLTNYTVVYDNNDTFTTDFITFTPIKNNNNLQLLFKIESEENNTIIKNNEIINWDVNFNNIFKCRVDDNNKINVYYINSFGSQQDLNNYFLNIVECVKLFDNNTYPVILINSFNGEVKDIYHKFY